MTDSTAGNLRHGRGGITQAVTSVAQGLGDADTAHEMESQALRALEVAATL
jgi:hypothetical protein